MDQFLRHIAYTTVKCADALAYAATTPFQMYSAALDATILRPYSSEDEKRDREAVGNWRRVE